MKKLKIAQLAPLWEQVPPKTYGGIERVVSDLTENLVSLGHNVTLFASGDSETKAKLDVTYPRAIRLDPKVKASTPIELLHACRVFERAGEFDIIHNHMGHLGIPFSGFVKTPVLTTMHSIFPPEHSMLFRHFKSQPYVSISNNQRGGLPELNYVATVYNGINMNLYKFNPKPKNYLLFMGRSSPLKGPHLAIAVAKKVGMKLILASKVDPGDREYHRKYVQPHIDGKQIVFKGELNDAQRVSLYENAFATLFPIQWREPFGLVMTESMACGTPVVALRNGSVPEVIKSGKTGFICRNVQEMAKSVSKINTISREACRKHVDENFSVSQMIDGYLRVYEKLIKK